MKLKVRFSAILMVLCIISIFISGCSGTSSTVLSCEVPIPVPPVSPSAEEAEYSQWYEEMATMIYDSQDQLDESLVAYAQDPSNDDQRIMVALSLVKLSSYYEVASEKLPPSSFDCVHQGLVRALQEYHTAVEAVKSGNVDENFLKHLENGKKMMFDAGALYEQWKKGHQ